MKKRDIAIQVAQKYLGLPYIWGGNDPITGFDCSGLIVEILQSVGIVPRKSDFTADALSKKFSETDVLQPGNLVFYDWNKDGIIDHVEMIAFIDDSGELFTIGASGGSSATTTPQAAAASDAFVKVRPLLSGYTHVTDPFNGVQN